MRIEKLKNFYSVLIFLFGLLIVIGTALYISRGLDVYDLIAGGDFYSIYGNNNFDRYWFAWINQIGQGAFNSISPSVLYYKFLGYLSEAFRLKPFISNILLFYTLSYLSSYLSLKIFFKQLHPFYTAILSIFYALNILTYHIFTYPWAYTHHFLIYIFIPPILSLFFDLVNSKSIPVKKLLIFIIINSLSLVSYSNISFFIAILLSESAYFSILLIAKKNTFLESRGLLKKYVILILIQVTLVSPYLLSFILNTLSITGKASGTSVFGGNILGWLSYTSSTYAASFAMHPFDLKNNINLFYFLLPFLLIYLPFKLSGQRNSSKKPYIVVLLILFLIAFSAKMTGPFSSLVGYFFRLPLTAIFRSPDKINIFFPFLYTFLLAYCLIYLTQEKFIKFLIVSFILYNTAIFFFTPPTQAITDNISGNTYAIEIPDAYKDMASELNGVESSGTILSLPYSVKNSINWSNYPSWGFIGHDVLHLLFNRIFISANTFDHPNLETGLSLKELNKLGSSSNDLIISMQNFSAGYLLWHKDVSSSSHASAAHLYKNIKTLEAENILIPLDKNNFFEMYRLQDEFIYPMIKTTAKKTYFTKISPIEYRVSLEDMPDRDIEIILNQSFDGGWEIVADNSSDACEIQTEYLENTVECRNNFKNDFLPKIFSKSLLNGGIIPTEHTMVNNYANKWKFSNNFEGNDSLNLTLIYKPQKYLVIQLLLTLLSAASCFVIFLFITIKEKISSLALN